MVHGECSYWEGIVRQAKREARGELSVSKGDWQRQGAADSTDLASQSFDHNPVPRVHAADLTVEQFVERFERPKRPVIISGLLDDWPAQTQWTVQSLLRRFPDTRFKVGTDDDGYPVRMKLKHYLLYVTDAQQRRDDSPLYIFDGSFADSKVAPPLGLVRRCPSLRVCNTLLHRVFRALL